MPEITNVPLTASYMSGIFSLRGTIVPLFDLRLMLKLSAQKQATRILIVESGDNETTGFLVDEVRYVIRMSEKLIEPAPATMIEEGREFLLGIGHFNEKIIVLLDIDALLEGEIND